MINTSSRGREETSFNKIIARLSTMPLQNVGFKPANATFSAELHLKQ